MQFKQAGVTPESAVSPLPQVELKPSTAPGAQPKGLSPKTNYSRVNSGSPPLPDAGAAAQKSAPPMGAAMLPKLASEGSMGLSKMTTLQDMVKAAMAGAAERITASDEAVRYGDKIASASCKDCGKSDCKGEEHKTASVSTDYAEKFASALEYALPFLKEAEVSPGTGPGALEVSETTRQDKIPEHHGQANAQPPMRPGEQKAVAGPANQMANDAHRAPGGSEHQKVASKVLKALSKVAEDKELEKKETEGMNAAQKGLAKAEAAHKEENGEKKEEKKASPDFIEGLADGLIRFKKEAEDRINPAKISGGPAKDSELHTSAAGEAGGAPVGGPPKGPTGLVGSNDSAINYNRAQARAGRKGEMDKYINEPMMSGKNDSTLKDVLTHASAADGNKFAGAAAHDAAVKTAAARALLAKLNEEEEKKASARAASAGN